MDYKAETTLNEKDSLQDMLILEKTMAKIYATALTEGASEDYKKTIKCHFNGIIEDQTEVFNKMTELGYYELEPAPENVKQETKDKFCQIKKQLC
jgi:spore coat protein CotF